MTQNQHCPICGDGYLELRSEKNHVEYKGREALLDMTYALCDCCGSEQANPAIARENKRRLVAFKKEVDGLLSGKELRAIREHLGITQAAAAKAFGGGPVAFSKYETDDVMQSDAMDRLIRVAAQIPEAWRVLAVDAGLEPKPAWTKVEHRSSEKTQRSRLHLVRTHDFQGDHLRYAHA